MYVYYCRTYEKAWYNHSTVAGPRAAGKPGSCQEEVLINLDVDVHIQKKRVKKTLESCQG